MKKVIHIAPSMQVKGGISSVLKMYLKTNLCEIYDIKFISTHMDGSKSYKVVVLLNGIIRLIVELLSKSVRLIHIHCGDIPSPYRKYIVFKIVQQFKTGVILHLHGGNFLEQYNKASEFWKMRLEEFIESADAVICLSQAYSDALGQLFPQSRRIVIPNSIVLPREKRITEGRHNGRTEILFLGLIKHRKGFFDLLICFERLVNAGYDVELLVGGNGEVAKLTEWISRPHLRNRVRYLGWVSDEEKDGLLRSSDMFVLPSYAEGMPVSILEAMGYCLPVVSTPVGGIPDLVEDGVTGYLVNPGDLDCLYEKLKTLIEERELGIEMGQRGREKLEKSYDAERNYQNIIRLYERLLSQCSDLD